MAPEALGARTAVAATFPCPDIVSIGGTPARPDLAIPDDHRSGGFQEAFHVVDVHAAMAMAPWPEHAPAEPMLVVDEIQGQVPARLS
jgi:hypothetical protein